MTDYNPIFRSPITSPTSDLASDLGLSDLTGVQVSLIQGDAANILQKQFSNIPASPGDLVDVGEGLLACLTPTEFYLFGKSPTTDLPSAGSLAQAKSFAHTTDLTHGKAVLKLTGPAAAEALGKICGLDFHNSVFPNMQVKQTSAAKVKTLIARCDENGTPVYHLHMNRPFGQYFWETLWDAGQEFGIGH